VYQSRDSNTRYCLTEIIDHLAARVTTRGKWSEFMELEGAYSYKATTFYIAMPHNICSWPLTKFGNCICKDDWETKAKNEIPFLCAFVFIARACVLVIRKCCEAWILSHYWRLDTYYLDNYKWVCQIRGPSCNEMSMFDF